MHDKTDSTSPKPMIQIAELMPYAVQNRLDDPNEQAEALELLDEVWQSEKERRLDEDQGAKGQLSNYFKSIGIKPLSEEDQQWDD